MCCRLCRPSAETLLPKPRRWQSRPRAGQDGKDQAFTHKARSVEAEAAAGAKGEFKNSMLFVAAAAGISSSKHPTAHLAESRQHGNLWRPIIAGIAAGKAVGVVLHFSARLKPAAEIETRQHLGRERMSSAMLAEHICGGMVRGLDYPRLYQRHTSTLNTGVPRQGQN